MGNDFLGFVEKQLSGSVGIFDREYYLILEKVIEIYKSINRNFFINNLELLLTSLSLSLYYEDKYLLKMLEPIYREFISKENHGYFFPHLILGRIINGIRNAFLNHHTKISDYLQFPPISEEPLASVYNKFFDMLEGGDSIVTLNYDVLCEQGLWEKNKWTFLDGYGFNKTKEALMGKDNVNSYKKPDNSLVKIYKLHGSLNWAGYRGEEEIILTDLQLYFKGFKGMNTEENKFNASNSIYFILPNYVKSFIKLRPLLEIWHKAKESISSCEELYFIGYSLSDIDSLLQFMLYDAINVNRKLDRDKIWIIDNQQIEHTASFTKKSVYFKFAEFLNDKFTFVNKSFEDWISER